MKQVRIISALSAVAVAALAAGACGEDRGVFTNGPTFETDSGSDAPECGYRCSLDGRDVIEACTGEVVEACRPEQACGAGRCQEPCAAAAADNRSDGCEFYLQTPRFTKVYGQSCFVAFVVNSSTQPAKLTLQLDGETLDISNSVYRTNPGDATLIPHSGPLPSGESAIVFVSDMHPDGISSQWQARCPKGVVPASYEDPLPDRTGFGKAFRLGSTRPVSVTSISMVVGVRRTATSTDGAPGA